ncbi:hypothetical protein [uncultured Alistipes sp.]|uniref:hypothetical protein n=1 Tax=uncultured Alistipes sp. TaxID=538949 RepID=UPI0026066832|nr:hypothetical protein [uncultured Alistipes sp.]
MKIGKTKASVIHDNNNILLNRKHPVLARTHLYTAQTTIRRVLANNEYAKNMPAIVIPFLC